MRLLFHDFKDFSFSRITLLYAGFCYQKSSVRSYIDKFFCPGVFSLQSGSTSSALIGTLEFYRVDRGSLKSFAVLGVGYVRLISHAFIITDTDMIYTICKHEH